MFLIIVVIFICCTKLDWIIAIIFIFTKNTRGIQSKSINPFIQPEPNYVINSFSDFRICPINIGLIFIKGMIIILPPRLTKSPGSTAKIRQPIIRNSAIGFGVLPMIPIVFRIIFTGTRFDKPTMLIGSMVDHQI